MNETPNTPISALSLMPSTKDEVVRFSKGLIDSVRNGETNPLKLLVMLRSLEAVSELVRDDIGEFIEREADKYSEKKFNAYGALIEKGEVGVKYAYETSRDPEWERLDSEMKSLKARISERETFLKSLKEPLTVLDKESGEINEIRPPLKKGKPGVKVFLR